MNRVEMRLLCYLLGLAGFILLGVGLLGGGPPIREVVFVVTGVAALVFAALALRTLTRRRRRSEEDS